MAIFSNQATLSYAGGSTLSNVVTGEITESVTVTKTAVGGTYTPRGTVTYAVSILRCGCGCAACELTVTDDLGAYPFGTGTLTPLTYAEGSLLYYADGVLQPTPTVTATAPLTVTGITLPAGKNALLIYSATANEFAPLGTEGSIVNTVTVTGTCIPESITASATVEALAGTALSIDKALCPPSICENGEVTYTFVISNAGNTPAVATDNLSVTDTFNPILSNITVTLDGEILTEGTDYTYDEATGLFQTTQSRITVPAATVTQDPETGVYTTKPGTATLTVTGNI